MTDVVLAEDGPARKRLVVRLTQYEGHRLLDLRFWYADRKSGEFKRTRKGIMFSRSNYLAFKRVVDQAHEKVMDWLGIGYVPGHVEEYDRRQETRAAELSGAMGEVIVETAASPRDPLPFCASHEGGVERLTLNSTVPFVTYLEQLLQDHPRSGELREAIALVFAAYSRARLRHEGQATMDSGTLMDSLEYSWAEYLQDLVRSRT